MDTQKVKEDHKETFFKNRNVYGTAVGEKWTDGKPTGQEAVLVFVQKKYPASGVLSAYSADELIPSSIDGVPTDVIEVGRIEAQGFRGKKRPLLPGHSLGHGNITAGTTGGFFYDKDGSPVILTNNHVAAWENKAKQGDLVFQPGPTDSRSNRSFRGWEPPASQYPYVGTLKDFVRIHDNNNVQDSATVEIHESLIRGNLVDPIYPVINKPLNGFTKPRVNMQVHKCGRTTGYTTGRVLALNGSFSIHYGFGTARFEECVVLSPMSKGGDSGSVIMDMDMNAVALLFAGSPKVTIANDIDIVRRHYGLKTWKAPNMEEVELSDGKWSKFTTDGTIEHNDGVIKITENANHHCFLERQLGFPVNSVECIINTGTDQGATWGPGIAIQWPNGMLKTNLRHRGPFGGYYNTHQNLSVGKTKPNTDYRLRIKKLDGSWVGQVMDGGVWYNTISVPTSIFPHNPVSIRIGKTGKLGSTRDHGPPGSKKKGASGTCTIKDLHVE